MQKLLLLQFSSDSAKFCEDIGNHGRIHAITFLGNWPFEILKRESVGKSETLEYLVTTDRKAKGMGYLDSASQRLHNKRPRGLYDLLGHLPNWNKLGLCLTALATVAM